MAQIGGGTFLAANVDALVRLDGFQPSIAGGGLVDDVDVAVIDAAHAISETSSPHPKAALAALAQKEVDGVGVRAVTNRVVLVGGNVPQAHRIEAEGGEAIQEFAGALAGARQLVSASRSIVFGLDVAALVGLADHRPIALALTIEHKVPIGVHADVGAVRGQRVGGGGAA